MSDEERDAPNKFLEEQVRKLALTIEKLEHNNKMLEQQYNANNKKVEIELKEKSSQQINFIQEQYSKITNEQNQWIIELTQQNKDLSSKLFKSNLKCQQLTVTNKKIEKKFRIVETRNEELKKQSDNQRKQIGKLKN